MPGLWVTLYQFDLLGWRGGGAEDQVAKVHLTHTLYDYMTDLSSTPYKSPGHQDMGEFPWPVTLYTRCHTSPRGLSSVRVTALEGQLGAWNWFSAAGLHPMHLFPLPILTCILLLGQTITVSITALLGPVSPGKSLTLRVA